MNDSEPKGAEDYARDGWIVLWYDDPIMDTIDKISAALAEHGLSLELCCDDTDSFQPIRVVKK